MNKRSEQLFERMKEMKNLQLKYKLRIIAFIIFLLTMNLGLNIVSENDLSKYYKPKNSLELEAAFNNKSQKEEFLNIYVKSGDTIWKIVEDNYQYISKPFYINFRDVVDIVIELNGGSEIAPGQLIKIPKKL